MRVLVIGADGRMGRVITEAIRAAPDLELAGTVVRGQDLDQALRDLRPTIGVEFTTPACVARHLDLLLEARVHPVIGTTGLTPTQCNAAAARARELGVGGVIAPNFSIGAVLCMNLACQIARHFPAVEIIETHHPAKKDAPSGTALATRELLAPLTQGPVPIHSVRLPGFVARQEVACGGTGERIQIVHEALDRSCYLAGVLLACRRVPSLPGIVLGLAPLLTSGDGNGSDAGGLDA